ncbi:MAG: hypothetical protein ACRDTC_15915 [Pseudonocardiaceae bacterium]
MTGSRSTSHGRGYAEQNPARSMVDALITATAKVHDWTVATRNVKDFGNTGVRVLNPLVG